MVALETELQLPLEPRQSSKADDAYKTIREVSEDLDIPQHVLRFWETKFVQIKPLKRGGGRRYYRPEDIAAVKMIQELLYSKGLTIKGAQKYLKERQHIRSRQITQSLFNGGGHMRDMEERLARHRKELKKLLTELRAIRKLL